MIKLWLLLSPDIKLIKLDDYLIQSFKIENSGKNAIAVKVSFKSIQDAILFCVNNKDQFNAVTEDITEMKDWMVGDQW